MRKWWFLILLVAALALAGCNGGKKSENPTPTATAFTPTPLPPTWTATPPGFIPSPTNTPPPTATSDAAAQGATTLPAAGTPLPPTWTPGKRPSATPRFTATPRNPTLGPAPTWTAQPEYCYTLGVVGTNPHIKPDESVTISWAPIAGIENYQVTVRHPGGGVILQQAVKGSSLELPGSLFTVAGAYGWDVRPLDNSGQPICFPVSGEIIVLF